MSRSREVGDFVVLEAKRAQEITSESIISYDSIVLDRAQIPAGSLAFVGSSRLIGEHITRYMIDGDALETAEVTAQVLFGLTGQADDEIEVQVLDPSIAEDRHGVDTTLLVVTSAQQAEVLAVERLCAEAHTIDAERYEVASKSCVDVFRIGFDGEFSERREIEFVS
jgi:hypothetical protein